MTSLPTTAKGCLEARASSFGDNSWGKFAARRRQSWSYSFLFMLWIFVVGVVAIDPLQIHFILRTEHPGGI
jgi:hypothetical protein